MQQNYKNNKVWQSGQSSRSAKANKSGKVERNAWSKKSTYSANANNRNKNPVTRNSVPRLSLFKNIFNYIKIPKIPGFKGREKVRSSAIFRNSQKKTDGIGSRITHNQTQNKSHNQQPLSEVHTGQAGQSPEFKVFQPAKSDPIFSPVNTAKNSLLQTYFSSFFKEKKFQFGFKNVASIKPTVKQSVFTRMWYNVNYFMKRIKLLQRFNYLMLTLTLGSLGMFFLYLCFFDTFFIVKDYKVTFAPSSYLSPTDVNHVLGNVKDDKLFGFIPNNQFWYLSSRSITIAAQSKNSEIDSITVTRKLWPNYAELEIKTEPILITLGINKTEYWRIGYDGTVVSLDDAGLRENLVVVERPVTFNKPGATLQDYSFAANCDSSSLNEAQNCAQLNRFWFVVWLWSQLDQLKIDYTKTSLPSLFDSDVVIQLNSGSRLIFDSGTMSKKVQKDRIVSVLDSIVGSQVNNGEIKYIDFRQPKKVFICRTGQPCVN